VTTEQWAGGVGANPGDQREQEAEVLVLRPAEVAHQPGVEVGVGGGAPDPVGVVELRPDGWVERWAGRPIFDHTPEEWRRLAVWRARAAAHHAGWVAAHAHVLAWRQVVPTGRGLVAMVLAVRGWQQKSAKRAELAAMETRDKAEGIWAKHHEPGVKRRFWVLVVLACLVGVAGLVGYLLYGWAPILAGAGLVLLAADMIGHRLRAPGEEPDFVPPPMPVLIDDPNVPLSQLQLAVLEVFEREGMAPDAVGVATPLRYDPLRLEYRMVVSCPDEIAPKHLRAIERAIGAEDFAVRCLATGTATNRELVIRQGDPLAHVPRPEWLESGSRTIVQPLDLGVSAGEVPLHIVFAGVHVAVVGKTGSGKTKAAMWSIIDRLSACRDARMVGIDLSNGPAFPMWRRVFAKTAYSVEDAEALLDWVLGEIDRRMAILTALAEDDDPDNDTDEWHSGLGPAMPVVIDEFAVLAGFNGEKGKPDLLDKVERIIRTGRKVWVTLIIGTQKAGNSDFGSSVMSSQFAVKILLACTERDTVALLSTEARDKGWLPHTLRPSVPDDPRDAGKCYVESPAHRAPDVYRFYAPLAVREVKRRAMQRVADGLPDLDGVTVVDAVEVPAALAFLEQRFAEAGDVEELPSAAAVAGSAWTQQRLADELRPFGVTTKKVGPTDARRNGYRLRDVRRAIEGLS
jgi:hypothetical protein